ncbi:hypothetical protein [Nocardia salmonicida]|uniref:hypothetical protein n=1 Tax=Nocardia salmonicida TaxID=53431 RepID=UPI003449DCCC
MTPTSQVGALGVSLGGTVASVPAGTVDLCPDRVRQRGFEAQTAPGDGRVGRSVQYTGHAGVPNILTPPLFVALGIPDGMVDFPW